jgi:hypothetical protein
MNNKIKEAATAQAATPDVSQQARDIVTQTTTDPNTAPCATPVADDTKQSLTGVLAVLNREKIRSFDEAQLIAELRKHLPIAAEAFSIAAQNADITADFYEAMVHKFRDQHKAGDKRDGKLTLKQAFIQAGWPYDAARKWHQRYETLKKNLCLPKDGGPEKLKLTAGDTVKSVEDDKEFTVVEASDLKADLVTKKDDGTVVERRATLLYDNDGIPLFKRVPSPVKKINVGDLVLLVDMYGGGAEFRYDGKKEFSRTDTLTVADQRKAAEAKKTTKKNPPDIASNKPAKATGKKTAVKVTGEKVKKAVKKNRAVTPADAGQRFEIRHDIDGTPQGCGLYCSNARTDAILIGTRVECEARRKEILDTYAVKAAAA